MKKFYAISCKKMGDYYDLIFIVNILKDNKKFFRIVKIVTKNSIDIQNNYALKKGFVKRFTTYSKGVIASADTFKECCELAMLKLL